MPVVQRKIKKSTMPVVKLTRSDWKKTEPPHVHFKPSPFYTILSPISDVVRCPGKLPRTSRCIGEG